MTEAQPVNGWAAKLKAYRKRRQWTQERMGQRFGVTRRTIIRWEKGEAIPSAGEQELLETEIGKAA